MKMTKRQNARRLSIALVLLMVVSILPMAALAAPSDIEGHWAKDTITKWVEAGKASGYEDGTFKPENPITRAEFMVLVNKSFGFSKTVSIDFTDVPADAWYAEHVAKAKAAGYIGGYPDGTVKPGAYISRQEVAVIIAKLKNLTGNASAVDKFNDASQIPDWSKGAVGAVVEAGYMNGYPNVTFKPTDNIKRAEALVALDNLPETVVYDKAGTYGPEEGQETIDADVIINEDGVVFQNIIITGDLTIGEGVGDGTVTLNEVTVKGDTFVRGGGTDSIVINGGSYGRIIIRKTASGAVRIVAVDAEGVEIVLSEDATGETVVLEGTFESVIVDAPGVVLETQGETEIGEMLVTERSENVVIRMDENTTVTKLIKEIEVEIEGEPEIKEVVEPEEVEEEKKGGGGGGPDGPSLPSITVSNVKVYNDTDQVIATGTSNSVNLTDKSNDTRLSKVTFEVDASPSTLTITGVSSPRLNATISPRTKNFSGTDCEVDVDFLLNIGQSSVSLGTLRNTFGNYVQVQGTLTADGYRQYNNPIMITLATNMPAVPPNEWATLEWTDQYELTATIIKDQKLSTIGIATFLQTTFNRLPKEVKIGNDWIEVKAEKYTEIKNQLGALGDGTDWNTVTTNDLKGKTILFKVPGSSQEYTLVIN